MGKFIAKFRKERDYDEDFEYSQKKRKMGKHDRTKKMGRVEHDIFLNDDTIFDKKARRKARHT